MNRITSCAKKMLNIHNASNAINKFVHNDNRFSTNKFVWNNNHSNTNEFMHDDDFSHTKCSQYEARLSHFEKAFSIIQSLLTFIVVVLSLYVTFQQFVNLFISNQATIANLYSDQMIMSMTQSSSYNEIALYETFALFTDSSHDQISKSFDLSMFITQSTSKYAYNVNLEIYKSFYDGEHVFNIY